MCIGLRVKYPLFLSDFNETKLYSTDFRKILKYQISWKSVQWGPSCSIRREMTKLKKPLFAILRTRLRNLLLYCFLVPRMLSIKRGTPTLGIKLQVSRRFDAMSPLLPTKLRTLSSVHMEGWIATCLEVATVVPQDSNLALVTRDIQKIIKGWYCIMCWLHRPLFF
jgi:hypothetical protein